MSRVIGARDQQGFLVSRGIFLSPNGLVREVVSAAHVSHYIVLSPVSTLPALLIKRPLIRSRFTYPTRSQRVDRPIARRLPSAINAPGFTAEGGLAVSSWRWLLLFSPAPLYPSTDERGESYPGVNPLVVVVIVGGNRARPARGLLPAGATEGEAGRSSAL